MRLADHIRMLGRRRWLTISATGEHDYVQTHYPYNMAHTPVTVQVDFDGTLTHKHGGLGTLGPLKPNSVPLINELHRLGYEVSIFTANPNLDLIGRYLMNNGITFARITNRKEPAVAYLDDRAVHWTGDEPVEDAIKKIKELTPG